MNTSRWMVALVLGSLFSTADGAQQTPNQPLQLNRSRPMPSGGRTSIPSITEYRQGTVIPSVTLAERLEIDLSEVDLEADPLLIVNGTPIRQEDLRRALCLMVGSNEIDQFITYQLASRIKKELEAEGTASTVAEVSEEEVRANFEEQKQMAADMGVDVDAWEKQFLEVFGWEGYVEFQKTQLAFEKLVMPDPPPGFLDDQAKKFEVLKKGYDEKQAQYQADLAEWKKLTNGDEDNPEFPPQPMPPEVPVPDADLAFLSKTCLALLGEGFDQVVMDTYARGQKMHPMLRRGIVQSLKRNMMEKTEVALASALPEQERDGVLLTVDGEPIPIAKIYNLIEPRLTPSIRRLGLRQAMTLRAVDHALREKEALSSREELNERYAAMKKKYEGSLIPLENAIILRGFPNVYLYREYFNRKSAYKEWMAAKTSEEDLRAHFDTKGKLFFENGSVDGVILFVKGETREETAPKMQAALKRVRDGESFEAVAKEVSDLPEANGHENGVFRGMVRNRLRQLMQETEFTTFITGYSLADEVFYRAVEDQIVGPAFREFAPELTGEFAVQVRSYASSGARRTFEEYRDNVLEDLSDVTFPRFANEALLNANLELPASE